MIDYVKGILAEKEITRITIEAHGVGYSMSIPLSTYEQLPGPGSETKIYTHFHVREDAQKLYGFFTKTERELFRQLISVNMIGPKVGLNILSGISVNDLVMCVNNSDTSRLEKIPGIGSKTAQRMLVELHGKLLPNAPAQIMSLSAGSAAGPQGVSHIRDEAFAAMMSLGYNDKQVSKALVRVEQTTGADAPVEEWIRKALQVI